MKIYVGCSLTYAPEEYKKNINKFKDELRKKYEVLDFLGLENGTANDVYEYDKNCVKNCDIMIAECSLPSLGLGYEIGYANSISKPIIAIAKNGIKVARMIEGINTPNFSFHRYEKSILEAITLIDNKINK